MSFKSKKQQDSLALLQKDLNELGLMKYLKAKKARNKIKKQQQKENKKYSTEQIDIKLPPIYGDNKSSYDKAKSFHQDSKQNLFYKIKQFENKITDLQAQNAIQKRQNEKLVDYVVKLKNNNRSMYQSNQPKYHMPQMYPPFPQMYPPYQPYMPFPNMNMPNMMNPYQMPYMPNQQQNPTLKQNNQPKKAKSYKKKKKLPPLSQFRAAAYAVYFAIFFKKYTKSFTLNRFDVFKENWTQSQVIQLARENLKQYLSKNISFDIFLKQQICQLDSLRNIKQQGDEQNEKNNKKNKANQKNKKAKMKTQSDEDSEDSSDFQSQTQQSQDIKQQTNLKNSQKQNQQPNIFQFYLKIDIAVAFVVQFIKQIHKCIIKGEIQNVNPFLLLFLQRQFQPDQLHQEGDFKYLNFHIEKGYSQNQRIVTEYFLIKNIYLDIFVNKSLLNQLAKKFFLGSKKKSQLTQQNKVFFSFFIRTSIFKIMIEQYLKKKIQKCQTFLLPNQQFTPFPRHISFEDPLHNQAVTFQNNGDHMKQQNIYEISEEQIKKKEKQLKSILDESCNQLYKRLIKMRKNEYGQLKQKTLSQKYRTQGNQYFKLHTLQQLEQQKQRQFIKTTNSIEQTSILNSRLKNSSNIARLKSVTRSKSSIQKTKKQFSESNQQSKKSFISNKKNNNAFKKKPKNYRQSSESSDD